MLETYPKDVKLVVKQFPLSIHNYAAKAAAAAFAADKQGKFWEMHHQLFANQKELSDAKVESIARELGLNIQQFKEDMKDPAVSAQIERDMRSASQANVQGTPTIFVNGRLLAQRSMPGFRQAIDTELHRLKQ